jgi:hypothetical protein
MTRGRRDERGAFMVVWALLIIAIFTMVAIVIDLGQLRVTRRDNQSVADFAALAAGERLGIGQPQGACLDAWKYIKSNAEDLPVGASSPCGGSFVCPTPLPTNGTRFTATGTGEYTVTFIYPATNADITDARFSGGAGLSDGVACERMGVEVRRARDAFFASVIGIKSLSTTARAVVKAAEGESDSVPSLWLLDPTECTSLDASGGSQINVGQNDNPATLANEAIAGLITIDSDGKGSTCSNTKQSMQAKGSGTHIWAIPLTGDIKGEINLFSMPSGATSCTSGACDQGDVSSGRVSPQPLSADDRATRAPVDWNWNCKSSLTGSPVAPGSSPASAYPNYRTLVPIPNCPTALTRPAYIDGLRAAIGTTASPGTDIASFNRWTTSGKSCSPSGLTTVNGNWWIDCPNLSLGNGTTVTINGNVVLDGSLSMTNGSVLNVNAANPLTNLTGSCLGTTGVPADLCPLQSAATHAYLYMRNGDINITGGSFQMNKTMVYLHDGTVKLNSAGPTWTSPDEGAFRGLSLWSEKETDFSMAGNGTLNLEGTFFTPNAIPFKLTGGGGFFPLQAQFISYHLDVSGGGLLNLVPNPSKNITLPPKSGVLIR